MVANDLRAGKKQLETDIAKIITDFYQRFGACDMGIDVQKFVVSTQNARGVLVDISSVEAIVNITLEI